MAAIATGLGLRAKVFQEMAEAAHEVHEAQGTGFFGDVELFGG